MVFPGLEDVRKCASQGNVVPVFKTILADTETPVSIWMKLFKNEKHSFLLESVSGEDTVARYSFIGGAPFLVFSARGNDWKTSGVETSSGKENPLKALREIFARYKSVRVEGVPRFTGGAVGYFAYDSIRLWENIPDKNEKQDSLDDVFFAFYKDLIVFDKKEHRMILISNVFIDKETVLDTAYDDALKSIACMEKKMAVSLSNHDVDIQQKSELRSNLTREEYQRSVERCKEYIKAGDIFQVVLSQRFTIDVKADPFDLFRVLRVVNPSPYMYYLASGDSAVIGASPEMLVRVEDGIMENRPIAGTRKRGKDEEEDHELIEDLMDDPKERSEHVMLVDLGRNDVGRVSEYGSVRVEDMMHIEKYSHVMHMVSNVKGRLREGCDIFDAFFSCFPAGTLSGAPKIRAMEIIDEQETVRRGLYGGALGYIDFNGNMDTCIVIRTIIYNQGKACIQSGAGIVADSVPEKEFQETVDKAMALFTAIKNAGEISGK